MIQATAMPRPDELCSPFRRQPLQALFAPKIVAVIGATEKKGSVGRAVFENLAEYDGAVFPVNPNHDLILGHQSFPTIATVPEKVDLAVVVTPAPTVPGIIRECVRAKVPGAIIISAGFKECGKEGADLEMQVLAEARHGQMRLIGPNCLGVMVPHRGFNPSFAGAMARPGNVAFISQSGALCTAVLDWSLHENVGFSAFVSVGSMLDVGWGDLIYYLGDDPHTRSIVIYMESVGDARSFLSAAREVAVTKPIIVLKVGRTEAASKAAASHTGSMTGSDEVLDAAFRRVGVLRVNTIEELFDMAEALGKQPRPHGPRLSVVTNAGGPGALATDALASSGGQLSGISERTYSELDSLLPPHWSRANPIDLLGDATPERYAKAVEAVARDEKTDGILVILTPQSMTDPDRTAQQLTPFARLDDKPILASWMGGAMIERGEAILNKAGIPTFRYPDRAARAFNLMWRYSENLRSLYETPVLGVHPAAAETKKFSQYPDDEESRLSAGAKEKVEQIIKVARDADRTILTEHESKQIINAYGIPVVQTQVALIERQAVAQAQKLGYPVAVKLFSETLTHKSDVGGVFLDVPDAKGVRKAWRAIENSVRQKAGPDDFLGVTVQPMISRKGYELILGSSTDAQFGPVLMVGAGGQFVEIFQDRALGLPPLSTTLARRLLEQTRIYTVLKGVRGREPVDLITLELILVRFSQLVAEQRWIKEIDINPLLASPDRLVALDARIVLHEASLTEDKLPPLAIRPYPAQYITQWKLLNGTPVTIRPIRPEDEPSMVKFHQELSDRSVYLRYFVPLKLDQRIAHERLCRICFVDYDREMALVAERHDEKSKRSEILAVGSVSRLHGLNEAEFGLIVSDKWQRQGLGTQLLKQLVKIGRQEKMERIAATILPDNRGMQQVARKAGFTVSQEKDECTAELVL